MSNEQLNHLQPEDFPVLLGAILSERLLRAERSLGDDGAWRWTYTDPRHAGEGEPATLCTTNPPILIDDAHVAEVLVMLATLASEGEPIKWVFGRRPVPEAFAKQGCAAWYSCRIFVPGSATEVAAEASADIMAVAIGLAMAKLAGADVAIEHRVMFPHRYLALN
jgi:hypothetical protein